MTKNLILFGGSFDPIHKGHLYSVSALIKEFPNSIVIVMPGINTLKNKSLISLEDRILSAKEVFKSFGNVNVVDWSLHWDTSSTFEVYAYLKKTYPDYNIFVSAGEDVIPFLPRWKHSQALLTEVSWIFFTREGGHSISGIKDDATKEMIKRSIVLKLDCLKISSTQIKNNPKDYIQLIPTEALPFISKYFK